MARRRALGQYFTPRPVAAFAVDALIAFGLSGRRLRVVDPACGEGVFLLEALRRWPEAEVWGCDLDAALAARWAAAGLSGPRVHMQVEDGLSDAPLWGLRQEQFGLVIGNPPYGLGLPRPGRGETIEALFVRRFVALARPGGWLAVVVPEGIVASDRAQRLRDWLQERVALKAIVALPEATFSRSGTAAHTALLLARKAARVSDAEVLLASPPDNCRGEAGLARYLSEVLARIRHR